MMTTGRPLRHVAAMREVTTGAHGAATFGEITTLSPGPGMHPARASADKKIVAVWTPGGSSAALQFSAIDRR